MPQIEEQIENKEKEKQIKEFEIILDLTSYPISLGLFEKLIVTGTLAQAKLLVHTINHRFLGRPVFMLKEK
jgi:hypothetical protein